MRTIAIEPFLYTFFLYAGCLIFSIIYFLKIFPALPSLNKKIYLPYFIFSSLAFAVRSTHCLLQTLSVELVGVPKLLLYDLPGMFMIAATIIFYTYFLTSLSTSFGPEEKKKYDRLCFACKSFLTFTLIALPGIFSANVYFVYFNKGKAMGTVYFYVYTPICLIMSVFAIYVMTNYIKQLKEFPAIMADKKFCIMFAIISAFFHGLSKVIYGTFMLTGLWDIIFKYDSEDFCYSRTIYSTLFIFYDVLPLISYTLYLKKDTEHISLLEIYEEEGETINNEDVAINRSSVIEDCLIKVLIKKGQEMDNKRGLLTKKN